VATAQVDVGVDFEISYSGPTSDDNHYHPVAGYNGSDFVSLFYDNLSGCGSQTCEWDIHGTHIAEGGGLLQGPSTVVGEEQDQWNPAVTWADDRFLAVWEDGRDGGWPMGIYGLDLSASGIPLHSGTPFRYTVGDSLGARDPAVAWGGTYGLVVWHEAYAGLQAMRVTASGAPVDSEPIVLTTGMDQDWHPRVASDGESFLVVWRDGHDVLQYSGIRVRQSDGAVLDDAPFYVGDAVIHGRIAVAWDGENYLAAYTYQGVQALLIGADGTIPPGGRIHIRGGRGRHPDVASMDPGFLVVYAESRPEDPDDNAWGWYGIYGMRISSEGETLDSSIPGGFLISNDYSRMQWHPRVAGGDGRYLVVWEDSEDWTPVATSQGVFGAVVTLTDDPGDTGDTGLGQNTGWDDEGAEGCPGGCSTGANPSHFLAATGALLLLVRRRKRGVC
jgi:hypothetical protein